MPRDFNLDDISTDRRIFIKKQEWDPNESREFYFTGKEKIERTKKDSTDTYATYLIYLIPATAEFEPELTLEIFASQAVPFKKALLRAYQQISITKFINDKGYDDWSVVGVEKFMPEKQRPEPADYPEMRPYVNKDEAKKEDSVATSPQKGEEEINIDDIPF